MRTRPTEMIHLIKNFPPLFEDIREELERDESNEQSLQAAAQAHWVLHHIKSLIIELEKLSNETFIKGKNKE